MLKPQPGVIIDDWKFTRCDDCLCIACSNSAHCPYGSKPEFDMTVTHCQDCEDPQFVVDCKFYVPLFD